MTIQETTSTASIPSAHGTYALVLHMSRSRRIRIGRLGTFSFPAGHYLYVGSAFGPGGLRARIAHHMKRATHPHWHIDYLRQAADVVDVWYTAGKRLECAWARRLSKGACVYTPVAGFGSSDCECPAHLFFIHADLVFDGRVIGGLDGKLSHPLGKNEY